MNEKNLAELRGPWKREGVDGRSVWATLYITSLGNKIQIEHMTKDDARRWMESISLRDGVPL